METRIIAYLVILLPALAILFLWASGFAPPGTGARTLLYFLVGIIGAVCALLMLVF